MTSLHLCDKYELAMNKITVELKSDTTKERVTKYLHTLYKFHKLTDTEISIVVEFTLAYYKIADTFKEGTNSRHLINKLLFDTDSRKQLQESLNLKEDVFNNYLSKFRKKKVIVDNMLNPNYIPPPGKFTLELKFV